MPPPATWPARRQPWFPSVRADMFPVATPRQPHCGLALSAAWAGASMSALIRGGLGGRFFIAALAASRTHGIDSPRARTTTGIRMHTPHTRRAAPGRPPFPAPLRWHKSAHARLSVGGFVVLSFFCHNCLKNRQTDHGSFLQTLQAGNSSPFRRVVSGVRSY